MLACYTAWKVNKWLDSKINDTAFKRSEELIHSLSSFIISLVDLIRVMKSINAASSISKHGLNVIQKIRKLIFRILRGWEKIFHLIRTITCLGC